jgi:hypothetical protein
MILLAEMETYLAWAICILGSAVVVITPLVLFRRLATKFTIHPTPATKALKSLWKTLSPWLHWLTEIPFMLWLWIWASNGMVRNFEDFDAGRTLKVSALSFLITIYRMFGTRGIIAFQWTFGGFFVLVWLGTGWSLFRSLWKRPHDKMNSR